jgi:hypothetical protein
MATRTDYAKKRQGNKVNYDSQTAASNTYNDYAGAQKNISVGPVLQPIRVGDAPGWSCDASTVKELPPGTQLAIYNNAGAVGSVTFGKLASVASAAPGTVDADGSPSIACKPNDWTYACCGERTFVITSANTLLVYVIQDHTVLK